MINACHLPIELLLNSVSVNTISITWNIPYLFLCVPSQVIITFYWFRQQKSSDYTQFVEWLLISYHIQSWLQSNLVIPFRNYFAIACCVSCERKCEFLKYFQIRLTVCWGKNGATLLWVDIIFGNFFRNNAFKLKFVFFQFIFQVSIYGGAAFAPNHNTKIRIEFAIFV